MKHVLLVVVLSASVVPLATAAQSLADVARKEEARRKAIRVPGKVYTNADLKPDVSSGAAAERPSDAPALAPRRGPEATADAPGSGAGLPLPGTALPVASDPGPAPEEGEAYWKALITAAREALERAKVLSDALQSRLNALATDIVNRDDPAQRAQLELERQRALVESERVKTEIARQTQAIADIEEDARKAGVPPGWLR